MDGLRRNAKALVAENGFFHSYALERWRTFGGRGSVRIRGVGASDDGFIRYYAGVALANRVDGLQRNAKALVRRKRIFPFLRVGEMGTFWWTRFGGGRRRRRVVRGGETGCQNKIL